MGGQCGRSGAEAEISKPEIFHMGQEDEEADFVNFGRDCAFAIRTYIHTCHLFISYLKPTLVPFLVSVTNLCKT